jgi:hypothetical protein
VVAAAERDAVEKEEEEGESVTEKAEFGGKNIYNLNAIRSREDEKSKTCFYQVTPLFTYSKCC